MPSSIELQRRPLHIPTLEEARSILGGRLPSIIENTVFTNDGLAKTPQGLRVPVYLASGLGFNDPGRYFLEKEVKPRMEEAGALVLDPFQQCGEFLDPKTFDQNQTVESQLSRWKNFNQNIIGTVNYGLLIPHSKIMFAVMEGYPTDEGVAAEVAYMATNFGPVIGTRTDLRLAENSATGTNPAVTYFMGQAYFGGKYFEGPFAYENAYELLKEYCALILLKHPQNIS